MACTATERQTVCEIATKMITETTIILQAIPATLGNATTVGKGATRLLVVGRRKERINMMMSTTSSWGPHNVEKSKKITMKNISKNDE